MAPIKGLTDRKRLPRLGKIHLGVKQESNRTGKEYPTATDYFVCPEEFLDVYGPEPKELDIIFPIESEDQFASTYYRRYSNARGLMCKGDGETANRKVNMAEILGKDGVLSDKPDEHEYWPIAGHGSKPEDIKMHQIICRGKDCPEYRSKACKQMMMLQFMCPRIPGLGIYQLDTTSYNSIDNVYGGIELIRMGPEGRIAGIPLKLRLGPMSVTPLDTGTNKTIHVLSLHYDFKLQSIFALNGSPSPDRAELPEPDDEVPTDLVLDDEDDEAVEAGATPETEAVMAPAPPKPAPPKPRTRATSATNTKQADSQPPGYDAKIWGMTNRELIDKLQTRRLDLGLTPELLREKAQEIGLDDAKKMKPDQFITLMDWMESEFGEAQTVPQAEITAGDESNVQQTPDDATESTEGQGPTPDGIGSTSQEQGAQEVEVQGAPAQVETGEIPLTREQRMEAISDDYTWEQTLALASEFGVRTLKAFESRILKVSRKEWEQLYEGTAATAARRLILTMMVDADAVVGVVE